MEGYRLPAYEKVKTITILFVLVLVLISSIYGWWLYSWWISYYRNVEKQYMNLTNIVVSTIDTMLLADVSRISYSIFAEKVGIYKSTVDYIAYKDGKLWATNMDWVTDALANVLYYKIKDYMGKDNVKVLSTFYFVRKGLVVGYAVPGEEEKLVVMVFPSEYINAIANRLLSSVVDTSKTRVMLLSRDGVPISMGNVFGINAFIVQREGKEFIVTEDAIFTYGKGQLVTLSINFGEKVTPLWVFMLGRIFGFVVLIYFVGIIFYLLQSRVIYPTLALSEIYEKYVKTGVLDRLRVLEYRRNVHTYPPPIGLIYMFLDSLSGELEKYSDIEIKLSSIYAFFAHMEDKLDLDDTEKLSEILNDIRRILGVDAIFTLIKEGNLYRINAYSGVYISGVDTSGLVIYSKYWDKFFTGIHDVYIEDIKKDRGVRDTIITGVNFISAFDQAVIAPLGINGMIIGLLVVLLKEDPKRDMRILKDLISIVAYMLTVQMSLAKVKAASDEIALNSLLALLGALEVKDPYTAGHSYRVALYARLIALFMGMSEDDVDRVYRAALLHDMGKEGIPDRILLKPAPLSDDEWEYMKEHPITSASIIDKLGRFTDLVPGILHHHTFYDGGGYPGGLKGENIPIIARIIAVADAYDAMTTDRPYRKALPDEIAIQELVRWKGKQFDPNIVDVFLRLYEKDKLEEVKLMVPSSLSFRSPEIMDLVYDKLERYMFVVVDINGLFYINKKYGNYIGNKVLNIVEDVMKDMFGDKAIVGRLDSDHVVMVFGSPQDYPTRRELVQMLDRFNDRASSIIPNRNIFKVAVLKYPEDFQDRRGTLHYASVVLALSKAMNISLIYLSDIPHNVRGE